MLGAPQRSWAVVLRSTKLGDTSKIVSALSAEYGRIKVVAKGARQLKSRSFASLEPGNEVELLVYVHPDRDLWTLADAQLLRSTLSSAGSDLAKLTHLFAALELAERLLPEREQLVDIVLMYRDFLENWHRRPPSAMPGLFFALELQLAGELGIGLDVAHCADCGEDLQRRERAAFVAADGVLRCDRCAGPLGRWLDGGTLSRLREVAAGGVTALEDGERSSIGRMLHEHLGFHLPNYRVPRALYWLREDAQRQPEGPNEDRA